MHRVTSSGVCSDGDSSVGGLDAAGRLRKRSKKLIRRSLPKLLVQTWGMPRTPSKAALRIDPVCKVDDGIGEARMDQPQLPVAPIDFGALSLGH